MRKIKKVVDTASFIERSKELYPNKFSYDKTNYAGYRKKVIVTCNLHGDFEVLAGEHLSPKNKFGCCPVCSRIPDNLSEDEKTDLFIRKVKFKFPNTKVSFEKTRFYGTKVKTKIVCPIHGEQDIVPNIYLCGKHDCPQCGRELGLERIKLANEESRKKASDDFIKISSLLYKNYYNYSKVEYVNDSTPVIVICPEHGEFLVTPNKHKNRGVGCRKCRQKSLSFPEYVFSLYLNENNVKFIEQYKVNDSLIKNMPFDFYIEKFNLLIEIQGKQHYEKRWTMTDKDLEKRQKIDNLKKDRSLQIGYNFIDTNGKNLNPNRLSKLAKCLREASNLNELKEKIKDMDMLILIAN